MDGGDTIPATQTDGTLRHPGFIIGISIGTLSLLSVIVVGVYCIIDRKRQSGQEPSATTWDNDDDDHQELTAEAGDPTWRRQRIDDIHVGMCPTTTYVIAGATAGGGRKVAGSCSICLVDFVDDDVVSVLPECCHVYHSACVDPWLKTHATCPDCRRPPSLP